jgi:hypothetical protein
MILWYLFRKDLNADFVISLACNKILEDLYIEERKDPFNRKFMYNPKNDVINLLNHSSLDRVHMKDSIELLTDIHRLRWSEVNDCDWIVIC